MSTQFGATSAYRTATASGEHTKKGGTGRNPCRLLSEPCYDEDAVTYFLSGTMLYPGKFMR